ncbi:MAG: hypothetical protein FJX75_11105 [Armatimonadetes bacterium]|nr:hypothetical protein [Armatimonadota bacterium]
MDISQLSEYGRVVHVLIGSGTRAEVEKAVERLAADGAWDLCGPLLIAASELGARVLVAKLLEAEMYPPLACAAAMRRQHKRAEVMTKKVAMARRVFRDLDTETDQKGVPDHIQAELDDLAATAEESREIADRREAERDACPVRALIINELSDRMLKSDAALDAMVSAVRASAFEDTRRSAALKIVTHPNALKRLQAAGRVDDLVAIALAARLDSAAETVAKLLTTNVDDIIAHKSRAALKLLLKHHPDAEVREKANEALR